MVRLAHDKAAQVDKFPGRYSAWLAVGRSELRVLRLGLLQYRNVGVGLP
jgi:hypothetical protein